MGRVRSRHIAFGAADGPLPRTGAEELAAGSGPSAGCVGETMVDFRGSAKAEAAPGTIVELGGDSGALTLSECSEVGALGQVLPQEPVGVFIGAAFPGVVRRGEVDGGVEALLECFVHVELGTVIRSDGVDGMRLVAQDGGGSFKGLPCADARQLADPHESAFAFDDGDRGWLAAAVDSVDLPVTESGALGDDGWSFGDHAFASETAAAVLAGVALPALLVGAAQMAPERATVGSVRPNVEIDGFDAHGARAFDAQTAHDLFGAEVLPQHALDRSEVRRSVAFVAPGAAAPAVGHLHREHRAIEAVVRTAVAFDLPTNRRGMSAQGDGDLRDCMSPASHRCDGVSFFGA